MSELAEWESFYVIVGGGAAALIGLQFVVLTLIAEKPHLGAPDAGAAFATPTIVHFSTVLLLAAVLRVPWQGIAAVAAIWGFAGLSGMMYAVVVARRMRLQTAYRPELEDWSFHVLLPFAAYATLALSALGARGFLAYPRGFARRRSRYPAAPFHRDSQRLGRGLLPRIRQHAESEGLSRFPCSVPAACYERGEFNLR